MLRIALFLLGTCLIATASAQQPAPAQPPKLTTEQEEKLKSREQLLQEATSLLNEGKLGEVRTKMEKFLAITQEVLGESHAEAIEVLNNLIDICSQLEDFPAAREYARKMVAAVKKINGEKHWKTTDAQLKLAEVDVRAKLTKDQRTDLITVGRLIVAMNENYGAGKYQYAVVLAEKALSQLKAILGEKHTLYAASLNNLGMLYQSQGMIAKAEPLFKAALAIRKETLGQNHPVYATSLNNMGTLFHNQSLFDKAEPLFKEAQAILKEAFGEKHPEYLNCLSNLAINYCKLGQYDKAEPYLKELIAIQKETTKDEPLKYAAALNNLAYVYDSQGLFAEAEKLYLKAEEVFKETAGPRSPEMAAFLNNLATRYNMQNLYGKAESLFKDALSIYKEIVGDKHAQYAISLQNLGLTYRYQGLFSKAAPLYKDALSIYKDLNATKTYEYATCLNNLAEVYLDEGSFAKAESLFKEALAICKTLFGETHANYATILQNLGDLYDAQGQFDKAESLDKEAKAIFEEVYGEKHPQYLRSLNKLAFMYKRKGQPIDAELFFLEAVSVSKEVLGDKHPSYAECLNNLALLYEDQDKFANAEPMLVEALAIGKHLWGEKHPTYASCLNNLGYVYFSEKQYAKAEPLFQAALAIRKELFGVKHMSYALSLNNLAYTYRAQGMVEKANPLEREALRTIEENLEGLAAGQSESGQFAYAAKARSILNNLLSHEKINPSDAYAAVFDWHGAVTARQTFARAAQRIDPKQQKTLDELRNVSLKLSNLFNNPPKPDSRVDIAKLQKELNQRREDLEKELANQSKDFARFREYRQLTAADLQKRLPADSAFIDFIAFNDKIAAFIITPKTIARVDLQGGNDLEAPVEDFRKPLSLKRSRPTQGEDDESLLYKRIWAPLVPHLKGANFILIRPDGPLCRLPFAALRGTDPNKYLIEEVALAVVPVPRMLPELLSSQTENSNAPPSLLVVGDVDFDGDPGAGKLPGEIALSSPTRSGGPLTWKPLSATAKDMESIQKLFLRIVPKGVVQSLSREKATEAAVRREIVKHQYLHLATHGFFSAGQTLKLNTMGNETFGMKDVSTEPNPGLLCGLVCAGANKPTLEDDGILTAQEIMNLNLSGVELAVLSDCDTDLGKLHSGDGVLGLQRAFQLAGARRTITSLWEAPDAATSALMIRFYDNLFQKKLSALESLREAQLWVLNNGVKTGILTEEPKNGRRTPPVYWAAFTLAGDWR